MMYILNVYWIVDEMTILHTQGSGNAIVKGRCCDLVASQTFFSSSEFTERVQVVWGTGPGAILTEKFGPARSPWHLDWAGFVVAECSPGEARRAAPKARWKFCVFAMGAPSTYSMLRNGASGP